MKKLLLLTLLTITLSCSKEEDDCECYYYERIDTYADCRFEGSDARQRLNDEDAYPEDLNRIKVYAQNFKCD